MIAPGRSQEESEAALGTSAPAESRTRDSPHRLAWVAVAAGLLALRKPWALHTPQLWAEDGSIFLVQDDQMGIRAWWEPYNGYLHLLPRIIAWIARVSVDVAWWPAVYNGLAFLLHLVVFARLVSPRLDLPHRAALLLALPLLVSTGEVLLNVTNLQWVTAVWLVTALFLRPAASTRARVVDLGLLALIGLNGPFAVLLWPFFTFRAWQRRSRDTTLAWAVITGCAVIQGAFLMQSSLGLESAGQPFQPLGALAVLGSRLVSWPLLGPGSVLGQPAGWHVAAALLGLLPFLAWSCRGGYGRENRRVLVALFVVFTAAGLYRVRADTWADDTLVNGDRYFFLPRLLLAWLVILTWDAPERWARWAARAACALAVALHIPHFVLPAPPDYRWAEHCAPIREGRPANINTLPEGWWIEYPGRR